VQKVAARPAASTSWRREARAIAKGLLFVSPWLLGFLAFRLYPFIASLYYSLTFYTVLKPPTFVGLENYQRLLTEDTRFHAAVFNTFYYAVIAVPLGTVAAIGLALLLNMRVRGLAVYRTIYYLPSITPLVAASIVWLWIYNPQVGVMNFLLTLVGIHGPGWLGDPAWAKPALIIMSVWGVGGAVIIYLAGLQDVPQELYEAAAIDGANELHKLWHVTLPMISPVILFNVVVGLIGAFQYFTQAYVMTAGGPADATLFFSLYLYFSAFQFFKMGYAAAMAWILFLIIVAFTALVFRLSGRLVYYGGR
jgi:multiple sugar transport system permease protein